jgi:hypothetical protein
MAERPSPLPTIRIVRPPRSGGSTRAASIVEAMGRVHQNDAPCPRSALHPTSPPICPMMPALMARPRPVPPNRRVVEASSWMNGWNNSAARARSKPGPVSTTSKRSSHAPAGPPIVRAVINAPPVSVNLTALPTKLSRT